MRAIGKRDGASVQPSDMATTARMPARAWAGCNRGTESIMFSSDEIWNAIDTLALRHGWSISRLSIAAGLDPTALNKSKRTGTDGESRWISTETMAKILAATRTPPHEFFDMICGTRPNPDGRKFVASSQPRGIGAKAHILLVDPDPIFSERMATGLGAAGYEIDMAPDLRHALAVVENGLSLDVLITNFDLPHGVQGRTLAHIALTYRPRLKVIFLTSTIPSRPAGISTETVLQKPLDAGRLAVVVARLVGLQAAAEKPLPGESEGLGANRRLFGSG